MYVDHWFQSRFKEVLSEKVIPVIKYTYVSRTRFTNTVIAIAKSISSKYYLLFLTKYFYHKVAKFEQNRMIQTAQIFFDKKQNIMLTFLNYR